MKYLKYIYIFTTLILFACSNKLEEIKPFQVNDNMPDVSIRNLNTFYNSSSRLQSEITAPLLNQYETENPYLEFPEGIKILFYTEKFEVATSLIADYAIYYKKQKLWKATGNVVVVGQNETTMKTEEIYGNEKAEKIYSIKFVEVADKEGSVIRGKGGFESNFGFTEYKFKNVDGIISGLNSKLEKEK